MSCPPDEHNDSHYPTQLSPEWPMFPKHGGEVYLSKFICVCLLIIFMHFLYIKIQDEEQYSYCIRLRVRSPH